MNAPSVAWIIPSEVCSSEAMIGSAGRMMSVPSGASAPMAASMMMNQPEPVETLPVLTRSTIATLRSRRTKPLE